MWQQVKGWGGLVGGDAKHTGQDLCQPWDAREGAQLNQGAIQSHLECTVNGCFYQTDQSKEHFFRFKHVYHTFMKFANLAADAASWSCYAVYLDSIWKT